MGYSGEFLTTIFMSIFRDAQLSNTTASLLFTSTTALASGFLK
jgi:hypothetical protein